MHPGAGIAPWNYAQYRFSKDVDGHITVEDAPLIFYHFHQFQLLENGEFDRLSSFYTSECVEPNAVYMVYEIELKKCLADVRAIVPDFKGGLKPVSTVRGRRFVQQFVPMWAKEIARRFLRY
jgi:GTPase SAR1 family protein